MDNLKLPAKNDNHHKMLFQTVKKFNFFLKEKLSSRYKCIVKNLLLFSVKLKQRNCSFTIILYVKKMGVELFKTPFSHYYNKQLVATGKE